MGRQFMIGEVLIDPTLLILITEEDGTVKKLGCLRDLVRASAELKGAVASLTGQLETGDATLERLRSERKTEKAVLASTQTELAAANSALTAAASERDCAREDLSRCRQDREAFRLELLKQKQDFLAQCKITEEWKAKVGGPSPGDYEFQRNEIGRLLAENEKLTVALLQAQAQPASAPSASSDSPETKERMADEALAESVRNMGGMLFRHHLEIDKLMKFAEAIKGAPL